MSATRTVEQRDQLLDRISRWLAATSVIFTLVAIGLMMAEVVDKNQALLGLVGISLATNCLGILRFKLLKHRSWVLLQSGAGLSVVAESFNSVTPVYILGHLTARVLIASAFILFLTAGSRENDERTRSVLPLVEVAIVTTALLAWFVAARPRFWSLLELPAPDAFLYFWGPLSHVVTIVPIVLLVARTRFSFGPWMMMLAYLLTSGATIGTFALGAAQTTPAAALPWFVPVLVGVGMAGIGPLSSSIVQLHSGTVPWRDPRDWHRTAWILAAPALIVGAVAFRGQTWNAALWPLLLLTSIAVFAIRAKVGTDQLLERQPGKDLDVVPVDRLEAWATQQGAIGVELSVIVVTPLADLDGRSALPNADQALRSIYVETLRRLRDVMRGGESLSPSFDGAWQIGSDGSRFVVIRALAFDSNTEVNPGPDQLGAARLAGSMVSLLGVPFRIDDVGLRVEFTVGYTATREPTPDVAQLIQDASWAARTGGPGETRGFDPAHRRETRRRAQLAAVLNDAVGTGAGLSLQYQPVVALRTLESVAAIVTAQWQPEGWGSIDREEFVAIAEQSRVILELNEWALTQALSSMEQQQLPDRGLVHRLSGVEVGSADLLQRTLAALERSSVDPSVLTLQVSDSLLGNLSTQSGRSLRGLAEAGVRLSLGGFGRETAGLSRMLDLPWHSLSLDPGLFADVSTADTTRVALLRTIVTMAQEIGVRVAAGGIESSTVLEILTSLGVDYGTGPLLGGLCDDLGEALRYGATVLSE